MLRSPSSHIPGDSSTRRLDPRVKIAVLAVYSCTLFLVDSWWGMGLMALLFLVALGCSRVPVSRVFGCGAVIYVLAAFTVLFNAVAFGAEGLIISGAGFLVGCFYAARILLLFWMSLLLCFTSAPTSLTDGFAKLLAPLRAIRVPVDDVALVLSLALRFIPLTSAEYAQVKRAQWARCAHFDEGILWQRLRAEGSVFVPLFVGLFRRADNLSLAMDARCYGIPQVSGERAHRTSLKVLSLTTFDIIALLAASAYSILVAIIF